MSTIAEAMSLLDIRDAAERFVPMEGCVNFRELGGYRAAGGGITRPGVLFRSDSLHWMTFRDRVRFDQLAIDTVIDLRSDEEVDYFGALDTGRRRVRYRRYPLLANVRSGVAIRPDERDGLTGLYIGMIDGASARIADIVRLLAEPETERAVIFCAAGKDRTGLVTAVVLSLLDVGERAVLDDYALSQRSATAIMSRIRSTDFYPRSVRAAARSAVVANPDWLRAAMRHVVDRYGSFERYLGSCGVGAEIIQRLRAKFVKREAISPRPVSRLTSRTER